MKNYFQVISGTGEMFNDELRKCSEKGFEPYGQLVVTTLKTDFVYSLIVIKRVQA